MKKASFAEYAALCLAVLGFVSFALWLNDDRFDRAEERITDLENRRCLMSGAHTGCEKVKK